jgi:hypothetical protein
MSFMKLNSPESLRSAGIVFRSYGGSWTAAREAGRRDASGVLVIPVGRGALEGSSGQVDGTSAKAVLARRNGAGN